MAVIINGKEVSAKIRQEIKENTQKFVDEKGYAPGLAVIIVGEDPASKVYVNNKHKACLEVGFLSEVYRLPEDTTMRKKIKEHLRKKYDLNFLLPSRAVLSRPPYSLQGCSKHCDSLGREGVA